MVEVVESKNYVSCLINSLCNGIYLSMSYEKQIIFNFIELPEPELQGKTGIFVNPETESIWELSVQHGKLVVDVPNWRFQIAPLSATKFRPVNSLVNLEIEFEEKDQSNALLMHLYAKSVQKATFELTQSSCA